MNDKSGTPTQLVAGFQDTTNYLDDTNCLGACVGRFAGRISGSFTLDGTSYPLHTVAPGVHLHGGQEGFFRKYWEMEEVGTGDCPYVRLSYESPHMEEGYPGNVRAEVTYTLEKQTLRISHRATTDRKTVVNLVNHSYFLLDLGQCRPLPLTTAFPPISGNQGKPVAYGKNTARKRVALRFYDCPGCGRAPPGHPFCSGCRRRGGCPPLFGKIRDPPEGENQPARRSRVYAPGVCGDLF